MTMTREEAIKALKLCSKCTRWHTGATCDGCAVDTWGRAPTPRQALEAISKAIALGKEAERLQGKIRDLLR